MFKNPLTGFDLSNPLATKQRSRNLFGSHTTPREFKHGARDIPFGAGAKSLYVDGTNGHDSNDGESWITAKATIQEAVDTADSWTQIFMKAGTYAENVVISAAKHNLRLVGESRDSIIVEPSSGNTITIAGDDVQIHTAFLKSAAGGQCVAATGDRVDLYNLKLDGAIDSSGIVLNGSDNTSIQKIYASNANHGNGIRIINTSSYSIIRNNILNLTKAGATYCIRIDHLKKSKIFENDIGAAAGGYGILIGVTGTDLSIFHNNLLGNNTQVQTTGSNISVFENFYDDHTNTDNGFGIATEPYAFIGGSDLRPVICRNGWNSISILRSLLRKKTAAQTTNAATDANGTAWVDLKSIAPTTSDIKLYRLKLTVAGTWAGTAKYRIIIGATKVYPFPADKDIDTGVLEDLVFPINIQINETAKIQFRSDNAADGAGETVALNQLDYATVL